MSGGGHPDDYSSAPLACGAVLVALCSRRHVDFCRTATALCRI